MTKRRQSKHLPLLFILAVLVPSIFLAFIAIRAANQEEASILRGIQRNLEAELTHVVSLMRTELERMGEELGETSPGDVPAAPGDLLLEWKDRSQLVNVPFLLSSELEILWPRLDTSTSDDDLAFLNWNREFVTDRTAIPHYQNIALLYRERVKEEEGLENRMSLPAEADAEEADKGPGKEKKLSAPPQAAAGLKGTKTSESLGRSKTEDLQVQQKAIEQFEKNPQFRQQVFDAAEEKGQQAETRTVAPKTSAVLNAGSREEPRRSIYISEPRKFSEIIAGRESGVIPRFIEENLTLMFWRRSSGGRIVGCLVGEDEFRSRLLGQLPEVYSPARVLTVLDENGRPLLTTEEDPDGVRDWRRPFSAREISEILPRWEAAVYLSNPDAISTRADTTRMIILVLVALFFSSILSGGFYILSSLRSQMAIARQKTTFVANVSHELKTPLTSIRMFAEMLKERRQPDRNKQEKYLDLMVSETDRLTRLINNVLDFSKMEKGKREYIKKRLDLTFLVEDMVESQRIRLEQEGFSVTFSSEMGRICLTGDEEALKQALLNLLSNAEKYSGDIKEIEVDIMGTADRVLVNVLDRGIGILPEEVKKIFREFYRVDESLTTDVSGSGLGLTIAQRIIRDHGGAIRHIPREGGGSIFQISLPLEEQPS